MDTQKAISIIDRSQTDLPLRKTMDYVDAHFAMGSFSQITVGVGPYCNLSCPPCYADCSPANSKARDPALDARILEQALDNSFDTLRLTDGEPLVERNAGLLKMLFEESDRLKPLIITNGTFSYSDDSLERWLDFFEKNGWSFDLMRSHSIPGRKVGSQLILSQGSHYPSATLDRLSDTIYGFLRRFGLKDAKDRIYVQNTYLENRLKPDKHLKSILLELWSRLGEKDDCDDAAASSNFYIQTELAGAIRIEFSRIREAGRGKEFLRNSGALRKVFSPYDICQSPHAQKHIHIDHEGYVGHGYARPCVHASRQFGNILDRPLNDIMGDMLQDPIFWIHKLGSVGFIYHLARQSDPNRVISGYDECGVCHELFEDAGLMDRLRQQFGKNSQRARSLIAEKYLEYAEKRYRQDKN